MKRWTIKNNFSGAVFQIFIMKRSFSELLYFLVHKKLLKIFEYILSTIERFFEKNI